ncbi:chromosomal replication initiator protein dnaA 1 [Waddlia chondrophila 2032/99]|uniref:Chromosomal replication initiator protein DnaA n=2 Tax=Waddlia chondrophila TaxID=71667 RepID=D6YW54_WADCW|nr:chromosomal replication initiator protein DnaA [Waddlia chondrophila]ADI38365.1 Chromosomal replication initiator protein dnaA [Waddlia chondrophila WSU 86-1044]CCB91452.1 chromosomal replication initiator protein dnaA 1 [Waddlia chondrophila 2032/99]
MIGIYQKVGKMQAWDLFLKEMEREIGLETAKKWLYSLKVADFDACNLYLEAKDAFQVMWFEEHVRKKANKHLVNNNRKQIKVHLSVKGLGKPKKAASKVKNIPPAFTLAFDELDPLFTFDHFIPSESNLLAHKLLFKTTNYDPISSQVVSNPSELASFNPIFLFGGKGTGKTHLLMATAHAINCSHKKALYVRSETFTVHVVSAIRAGEMSLFRQAYRSVDVLLIDDVHLFSKKWATQEELFHTFNALHLAGKQIILSANCAPQELQHIEPRLISRFEWGIVLPLNPLPKEDMRKVIQRKAKAFDTQLHPKVEEFLLEMFSSTTNSIAAALESLLMRHHLRMREQKKASAPITVQLAKHLLKDLIEKESLSALTPEKIIQIVAEYFGICKQDILSKNQKREYVVPRQLAMYFCRQKLKIPYTKLGAVFGRDHSTVISSIKTVQSQLDENNKEVIDQLNGITKILHK